MIGKGAYSWFFLFQLVVWLTAAQEADVVFSSLFEPATTTTTASDSEGEAAVITGAKLDDLFQQVNTTAATTTAAAAADATTANETLASDSPSIANTTATEDSVSNETETTTITTTDATTDADTTAANGTAMNGTDSAVDDSPSTAATTTTNEDGASTADADATDSTTNNMTDTDTAMELEESGSTTSGNSTDDNTTGLVVLFADTNSTNANSTNMTDLMDESDAADGSTTVTNPPTLPPGCSVTGGSNFWLAQIKGGTDVVCNGTDTCRGSTINGCNSVACATRDCWGAIILDTNSVLCEGKSACHEAKIGTAERPVKSVVCRGDEFTCYNATIFASTTIQCQDISGTGGNGICGFSTLETPCLQCIGENSGCNQDCKLYGGDCPNCRCGGANCEGVCPKGEEFCRVENGTIVDESAAVATTFSSRYYSYMTSLVVGMVLVSLA